MNVYNVDDAAHELDNIARACELTFGRAKLEGASQKTQQEMHRIFAGILSLQSALARLAKEEV